MIWRHVACLSYFALLFWILIWNAWIDPPYPAALLLLMLLTPLALALRGILYARPYSHAWLTLLTPFYFALGIGNAYANTTTRLYGCGLMLLSLILFVSAIAFVRTKRQKGLHTDQPLS